ncbi:MAG: hypothetical protein GEU88_16950, partial [Solirubrobacterales bacterium]|nr:hypothetical protein [Solirubrobacterales bacterium]
MSARTLRPVAPLLACALAFLLAGADPFWIAIAPVAVLLGALLAGRYPGESVLERLRGGPPRPRGRAQPSVAR